MNKNLLFLPAAAWLLMGGLRADDAATNAAAVTAPTSGLQVEDTSANSPMAVKTSDPNVVAHVGSDEIKTDAVRPFLATLDPQQRKALASDPNLLGRTVESILVQQVLYKRALVEQWDRQPDVVAQLLQQREKIIAESYLASATTPAADYPSEAEVKNAYEEHKATLIVPRQFRLAQIFIAVPKGSGPTPADAQNKLNALIASLAQPAADFAALARTSSDDKASAARGGEIGWVTEGQIQPELRSQVLALGKNAVSSPIKLDDGWHILKVNDLKESYTASLDQVHDQVVQQLRAQKAQALRQAYLAKLLQDNPITLSRVALSQLLPNPVSK
jgi:parvulin-like peptidyl-prolyl isomerase